MYDRILVPTDGSTHAAAAVPHAIDLATKYDAELHTVSVVDPMALGPDVRAAAIEQELERRAQEAVDEVCDQAGTRDVTATGQVITGDPFSAILEYVDDNDIDLVVLSTHGRSGIDRYLLGSVTEKLLRRSDVPILAVRPGEA